VNCLHADGPWTDTALALVAAHGTIDNWRMTPQSMHQDLLAS